ncbi:hypothetical protein D3C72_1794390 [compost metagenome]
MWLLQVGNLRGCIRRWCGKMRHLIDWRIVIVIHRGAAIHIIVLVDIGDTVNHRGGVRDIRRIVIDHRLTPIIPAHVPAMPVVMMLIDQCPDRDAHAKTDHACRQHIATAIA